MLEKTEALNLRDEYVGAMRNVANSVTIVTTNGPAGRQGSTVSSFCSVSADPPTVLVCLNVNGRTAHAIKNNGTFCVNVLPENAVGLAKLFAGINGDEETDRYSDKNWTEEDGRAPRLSGVTAFSCSVIDTVEATSHLIFIGKVNEVQIGQHKPLLYLDRKFCKTGSSA
ncbi:MAG: flavin reductase family protein [Pseudomonadota bacterium]